MNDRRWKKIHRKLKGSQSEKNRRKNRVKKSKNRALRDFAASTKSTCLYGSGHPFRNHFAAPFSPLRKFSKLRTQVWHTSATSQHMSPQFAAAKRLRSDKAWKSLISQPKFNSSGYFAIAKAILAHMCHFVAQWHSICSYETDCKVGCENGFLMRNWLFSAKLKMTLNLPLFLYIPVIWAVKGFQK